MTATVIVQPNMFANIKITNRQIRFLFPEGKVWMIHPLHFSKEVPRKLQGYYSVPHEEWVNQGWGNLNRARELKILKSWIRKKFKL
jgi:hypothetical protein